MRWRTREILSVCSHPAWWLGSWRCQHDGWATPSLRHTYNNLIVDTKLHYYRLSSQIRNGKKIVIWRINPYPGFRKQMLSPGPFIAFLFQKEKFNSQFISWINFLLSPMSTSYGPVAVWSRGQWQRSPGGCTPDISSSPSALLHIYPELKSLLALAAVSASRLMWWWVWGGSSVVHLHNRRQSGPPLLTMDSARSQG